MTLALARSVLRIIHVSTVKSEMKIEGQNTKSANRILPRSNWLRNKVHPHQLHSPLGLADISEYPSFFVCINVTLLPVHLGCPFALLRNLTITSLRHLVVDRDHPQLKLHGVLYDSYCNDWVSSRLIWVGGLQSPEWIVTVQVAVPGLSIIDQLHFLV